GACRRRRARASRQPGPRLPRTGEGRARLDQELLPPDPAARRYLRRGHPALGGRRVAPLPMDLSGLSRRSLLRILRRAAQSLSSAAAAELSRTTNLKEVSMPLMIALLLTALVAPAAPPSPNGQRLTAEDEFNLELATAPQISADGRRIVYVRNFSDIM